MKTPTWGEIEAFLAADGGWECKRGTKHDFYEKALPDGRVLNTHVSRAKNKSMHPATFRKICETQLGLTVEDFWRTLEASRSIRVGTVAATPTRPPTLAQIMELRRRLRLSDADLEGMTREEAGRRLHEFHAGDTRRKP